MNLFGYLMLSSATLGDGIHRIARYQGVLTGKPWISVEDEASGVRIRVGIEHEDADIRAIHSEYVAGLLLQVMSWVSERAMRSFCPPSRLFPVPLPLRAVVPCRCQSMPTLPRGT